jgi:hypothetical protein
VSVHRGRANGVRDKLGSRAAVLDERASKQPPRTVWAPQRCCLRASVEGSGDQARSAARDVRAADLQEETRKRRIARRAGGFETVVSSDPTKSAASWRTSPRAERAIERCELVERGNQI